MNIIGFYHQGTFITGYLYYENLCHKVLYNIAIGTYIIKLFLSYNYRAYYNGIHLGFTVLLS